jgi:hypothetical protein
MVWFTFRADFDLPGFIYTDNVTIISLVEKGLWETTWEST